MRPGVADTPRGDGNWRHAEELNGLPSGLLMSFVEFANHPAGNDVRGPAGNPASATATGGRPENLSKVEGGPVVLRALGLTLLLLAVVPAATQRGDVALGG